MIQVITFLFKILLKFYFLFEWSYISSWFSLIVIDWNKQISGGTWEGGPMEQDGTLAGPETRVAAGQRPRRPPWLSTGFLQVGGQRAARAMLLASRTILELADFLEGVPGWVPLETSQLLSRTVCPISALPLQAEVRAQESPWDRIRASCRGCENRGPVGCTPARLPGE